jgi:hypothetical protein
MGLSQFKLGFSLRRRVRGPVPWGSRASAPEPRIFPAAAVPPPGDAPLGLCEGVVFSLFTHSIGRRPLTFYEFINLEEGKRRFAGWTGRLDGSTRGNNSPGPRMEGRAGIRRSVRSIKVAVLGVFFPIQKAIWEATGRFRGRWLPGSDRSPAG